MDAATAFQILDIRVGTVVAASPHEGTRKPAIKLTIDLGPELGIRQSSAQATAHYTPETLMGRQVLVAVNLPHKRIAAFTSEALVLGVPDEAGEVIFIGPDQHVPEGGRLY